MTDDDPPAFAVFCASSARGPHRGMPVTAGGTRTGSAGADLAGKARYLLLSLAVLLLDQWTKWLVEAYFADHASMEIIPQLLNFTHVRNSGVAFGLFATGGNAAGTVILTLLGLGALAFVAYYFWIVSSGDHVMLSALALILGGAVGNLLDRIARGAVTDFVDFYFGTYHWHTFNVADSAITVGIALMILGSFLHQEPRQVAAGSSSSR